MRVDEIDHPRREQRLATPGRDLEAEGRQTLLAEPVATGDGRVARPAVLAPGPASPSRDPSCPSPDPVLRRRGVLQPATPRTSSRKLRTTATCPLLVLLEDHLLQLLDGFVDLEGQAVGSRSDTGEGTRGRGTWSARTRASASILPAGRGPPASDSARLLSFSTSGSYMRKTSWDSVCPTNPVSLVGFGRVELLTGRGEEDV